jgi:hypothetical protein
MSACSVFCPTPQSSSQYALIEGLDASVFGNIALCLTYEEQKKTSFCSKPLFFLMTAFHVDYFNKSFKIQDSKERFGLGKCFPKECTGEDCREISGRIEELMLGVKIFGQKYIDQVTSVNDVHEFEHFVSLVHSISLLRIFCGTRNDADFFATRKGSTPKSLRLARNEILPAYTRIMDHSGMTVDDSFFVPLEKEKAESLIALAEGVRKWFLDEKNRNLVSAVTTRGIVPPEFKECSSVEFLKLQCDGDPTSFMSKKYICSLPKVKTLLLQGNTDFRTVPAEIGKVISERLVLDGSIDCLPVGLKTYQDRKIVFSTSQAISSLYKKIFLLFGTNQLCVKDFPEDSFESVTVVPMVD